MPGRVDLHSNESSDRIRDLVTGIGLQLRSIYEPWQPAPTRFNELLDQLDQSQGDHGTKQSSRGDGRQPD